MSCRANVRRATDHRITVLLGYCLIGLLSCWVTVSWGTISRVNVPSGCWKSGYSPVGLVCLSGLYPRVSVHQASVILKIWQIFKKIGYD